MRYALAVVMGWSMAALAAADETPFQPVKIKVPEGYEVTIAAAPPLVAHPLMAGFDDRGRLYIAENAGLNLPRKELEAQLPNSVTRLEDTNGDGVFDKRTVFADKLTFAQGALWHEGSVYVASPPNIWKFTDTDDDGIADKREELVSKFGYTGNAADIHGCFLGPDGRIYWCDGRHGHEMKDAEGKVVSFGKAARIFSCKTDGSDVQVHCGGGMDNPVEIDFLPNGEFLGTVNLMYLQRGDCLVHWLRGGVYPREDVVPCIEEFPYTGGLLGPAIDFGHVAVSGTMRVRSNQLDPKFKDNYLVAQFNAHKIVRTELVPEGSTYRAEVHEFLKGESDDFHPTDVLEDADGSLLVIDTGGWFRIGCPTSQVARPNILGCIYRIEKKDSHAVKDPRGVEIKWKEASEKELIELFDDERFAVRGKAIAELAKRKQKAIDAIVKLAVSPKTSVETRLGGVWTIARIGDFGGIGHAVIGSYLNDPDPVVRQAAIYAAGRTRWAIAEGRLSDLLRSDSAPERRMAATSLGQLKLAHTAPKLLQALTPDIDRSLEHAVIFALIEINDPKPLIAALRDPAARVRRGALIALDQMPGKHLKQEHLTSLLRADDPALMTEVMRIAKQHPDWASGFEMLIGDLLKKPAPTASDAELLHGALVAFGGEPSIRDQMSAGFAQPSLAVPLRKVLLQTIAELDVQSVPEAWSAAVGSALADKDQSIVEAALPAAAKLGRDAFLKPLQTLARDSARPATLRLAALDVLTVRGSHIDAVDFSYLVEQSQPNSDALHRISAARVLSKARIEGPQAKEFRKLLASAGPLELASLVASLEFCESEADFSNALTTLQTEKKLINTAALDVWSQRFSESTQRQAKVLTDQSRAIDEGLKARLDELEASFAKAGDAGLGGAVFFSQRVGCSSCHRIGERGGRIGPDLTHIGSRRSKRDLLEAILAPSASQARGFETVTVETSAGKVVSGMIAAESSQSVTLRLADQSLLTLPRRDIDSLSPSPVSLMPLGLDRAMTRDQLAHLTAFLHSLK
jgi:putative heme-binding domain-containing protein